MPNGYTIHANDPVTSLNGIRPLTTIERSMIQTFPSDFIFLGSTSVQEQLIGNAVPVNLARFIAAAILRVEKINDTRDLSISHRKKHPQIVFEGN